MSAAPRLAPADQWAGLRRASLGWPVCVGELDLVRESPRGAWVRTWTPTGELAGVIPLPRPIDPAPGIESGELLADPIALEQLQAAARGESYQDGSPLVAVVGPRAWLQAVLVFWGPFASMPAEVKAGVIGVVDVEDLAHVRAALRPVGGVVIAAKLTENGRGLQPAEAAP